MKSCLKMDEFQFELVCPLCDSRQQIAVIDIDEKPNYCAMCGTEAEWDTLDD